MIKGTTDLMSDRESLSKKPWTKALLPLDSTLQGAVRCLEAAILQIVMVIDSDGVLIGTLTDGDIRRGLLRGIGLDDSIDTIIFRDPIVAPPQLGRDAVLKLMQANEIRQLPIVDESRKVIGLHLLDELISPAKRSNLMVIMAGGQGTRLRPHTETCPKPLLKVGGKPILEHIILGARAEGFKNFVLSLRYLGAMIEEYCGDGRQWGVHINYLREKSPLGTVGALGLLNPRPEAPFIVSNGDVLTDISYGDMLDFHCRYGASATMAVRLHEWQHPYGVVRTDGVDIIGFEEKPIVRNHINAGIYALSPNALNVLKENEPCDMPALFSRLQDSATRAIVYPMHEPWLDVGREDDLKRAQEQS